MRVVFVTQSVDAEDPVLGATVAKLKALAERCEELIVISDRVAIHDLPSNCRFRTFAAPTRLGRGIRYLRALLPLFAGREAPAAVIAHMCPIYLILAAPVAALRRTPTVLWYTHWSTNRTLRLATALSRAVLSVDRSSFPLVNSKVEGIGHGIDVTQFAPRTEVSRDSAELRLLALGRTSPTKGLATLVAACGRLKRAQLEFTCDLYGPSTTDAERRHRVELQRLIEEQDLERLVRLHEPVQRGAVPDLVRSADVLVNTHGGSLDKVVYESAACAVPVMAGNPHFDEFLDGLPIELRFENESADDLVRVIRAFAAADASTRERTGRELRRRVENGHSVESWADAVIRVIERLRG